MLTISSVAFAKVIVVFAPHPDDEVIPLGGWIADQVINKNEVFGVIVTDGEAYPKSVRVNRLSNSPILFPKSFLKLGKIRREEGIKSLQNLGINTSHQYFLGYPGNCLKKIILSPKSYNLIRSPITKRRYGVALWKGTRRSIVFNKASLTDDIDKTLHDTKPDIVVIPAEFDSNSDHAAISKFIQNRLKNYSGKVQVMKYLVHVKSKKVYPKPFGLHPEAGINNPANIPVPQRYFPGEKALAIKKKSLECHRSQMRLKDGFLLSFLRAEELYWK